MTQHTKVGPPQWRSDWRQSCCWLFERNTVDDISEIRIPNPHLGDEINHNIIRSEIEGGVYLRDLPAVGKQEIRTENHTPPGRPSVSGNSKSSEVILGSQRASVENG